MNKYCSTLIYLLLLYLVSCSLPEYTSEVKPSILVFSIIEPGKLIEGDFWWLKNFEDEKNEQQLSLRPVLYEDNVKVFEGELHTSQFKTPVAAKLGSFYRLELVNKEKDDFYYTSKEYRTLERPLIDSLGIYQVEVGRFNHVNHITDFYFSNQETQSSYFMYRTEIPLLEGQNPIEEDDTIRFRWGTPPMGSYCYEIGNPGLIMEGFDILNISCLEDKNNLTLEGPKLHNPTLIKFKFCNIDDHTINLFRQMVYNISYEGAHYNPYFLAHLNLKDDFPRSEDNYEIILNTACVDTTLIL
ncbi:hypothetical protein [Portibacter marinus]|uniref:hypothetical protein n=1 Tax=Portibacter marinus TaxID=2898660 RepID=UPI001F1C0D83|nr:hypothetical protein [Portibacter marinus]